MPRSIRVFLFVCLFKIFQGLFNSQDHFLIVGSTFITDHYFSGRAIDTQFY